MPDGCGCVARTFSDFAALEGGEYGFRVKEDQATILSLNIGDFSPSRPVRQGANRDIQCFCHRVLPKEERGRFRDTGYSIGGIQSTTFLSSLSSSSGCLSQILWGRPLGWPQQVPV